MRAYFASTSFSPGLPVSRPERSCVSSSANSTLDSSNTIRMQGVGSPRVAAWMLSTRNQPSSCRQYSEVIHHLVTWNTITVAFFTALG